MSVYVYAIRCGDTGYIKVGTSTSPARRMGELQEGSPHTLKLVCAFAATDWHERALHRALAAQRVRGEWFDFGDKTDLQVTALIESCDPRMVPRLHEGRVRLAHLREAQGLTQEEAATVFGVGVLTLARHERDSYPISRLKLLGYASFYGVDVGDIAQPVQVDARDELAA